MLNSRDQKFALEHKVEIRKQGGLEKAEEAKEPEERTMTLSNLAEDLGPLNLTLNCLRTLIGTSSKR